MRKDEPKKCIHCGTSLPYRYKGRQRIYCSDLCRKSYKKECSLLKAVKLFTIKFEYEGDEIS